MEHFQCENAPKQDALLQFERAEPEGIRRNGKAGAKYMEKHNTDISDLLEIVIITYNRKKEIAQTLDSLMASHSPVRQCPITILDNCSTDGASEVCAGHARQYANIRHVRHAQNIGGNANICRAYEIAQKEYVWCLSDDDGLDWSGWQEVEEAMRQGYDGIFTTQTNLKRARGLGGMLMECTFCPGCIYKRSLIDSDVLQGMYDNIHNFLPHITIALAIARNEGRFYIPRHEIVYQPPKFEEIPELATINNTRGKNVPWSALTTDKVWEIGFINMISLLDEAKRNLVYADLAVLYGSQYNYIRYIIEYYVTKNCSARNLFDIYQNISDEYKKIFLETIFRYFEMKQFDKIPLTLSDWNTLFIDSVAKRKTGRIKTIIRNRVRKFLMFLLKRI